MDGTSILAAPFGAHHSPCRNVSRNVSRNARRRSYTALVASVLLQCVASTTVATTLSAQRASNVWRDDLLKVARAAAFGPERAPVADPTVPRGFSTAGIPEVTFAAATGPRGKAGVAARITSKTAYPKLGIPAGVSYLWVDVRPPVRMAIIPADAARPAYWLPATPHHTIVGASSNTDALCKANPLATQLGTRRPTGATQLMMGACTCVDGVWMHAEGFGAELSQINSRVLLSP